MDEIWLYVALDNITAADAVLDEFERTCRLLSLQPNMGRIREELAENLRSFPVGRYLVFYRPQGPDIEIVRVMSRGSPLKGDASGESEIGATIRTEETSGHCHIANRDAHQSVRSTDVTGSRRLYTTSA